MSKPWFLDVADNEESQGLREKIKGVLGRDLGDAGGVVKKANGNGIRLEEGEGLTDGPEGGSH